MTDRLLTICTAALAVCLLILLGGTGAQVSFAGAQGGFAGLGQTNVLLPRSLTGRREVNLVLSVDGKAANTVKLWIK